MVVGVYEYVAAKRTHEAAQREEYQRRLNKGIMSAHWAAHYGMHVFQIPAPFTSIDMGVAGFAGTHVLLEAERQGLFEDAPSTYEHTERRLGQLTAATTMETLFPLLIVLMLFGTIAGERDSGTLRQLASLGVSPRTVAFGKSVGAMTPMLLLLLVGSTVAATLIAMAGPGAGDLWTRAAAMLSAYLVYGCWFAMATVMISMFAPTARHALIGSLVMWFVVCLVAPRVAAQIGLTRHPEPTPYEFAAGLERNRQNRDSQRSAEIRDGVALRYYNVRSVDALPANAFSRIGYLIGQAVDDDILSRNVAPLLAAYRQQDHVYQMGAWLSPTVAVQALSMALAGQDVASQERFWQAARRYGFQMQWTMHEDVAAVGERQDRGRDVWARVPPFQYQPMSAREAMAHARTAMSAFSVSFTVIALLTIVSIQRLRV
jgi:ABC-2 type transport system permease protein